MLKHQISIR